MRTRLQHSWHRTYKIDIERTLDFRDSPVRTPQQNPVHASLPAACAANWARNVAVAPSTPGFRARPCWQIRRPCCSRWYPREPDSGGRRSLPAPCTGRCAPATISRTAFAWKEERTLSQALTLQYDKRIHSAAKRASQGGDGKRVTSSIILTVGWRSVNAEPNWRIGP